jgi:hypothetical protein
MNAFDLYEMIERRYQPPGWAVLPGVASATGTGMQRRCDAIAMSLWPSRGLELHGFEIKVSRGDFLRELKDPDKAEKIARYCDRWWLVTDDDTIVQNGELPPTWGLLVRHGKSLRLKKEATKLEPIEISRRFLAALLRVSATSMPGPKKLEAETKAAHLAGYEEGERSGRWSQKRLEQDLKDSQEKLDKLTTALGINQHSDLGWRSDERLSRAFRFATRFALDNLDSFDQIETHAKRILAACAVAQPIVASALEEPAEPPALLPGEQFDCEDCGTDVKVDEDGCCAGCGRDCTVSRTAESDEERTST